MTDCHLPFGEWFILTVNFKGTEGINKRLGYTNKQTVTQLKPKNTPATINMREKQVVLWGACESTDWEMKQLGTT